MTPPREGLEIPGLSWLSETANDNVLPLERINEVGEREGAIQGIATVNEAERAVIRHEFANNSELRVDASGQFIQTSTS